MIYSGSGDLPRHIYCYVDSSYIRKDRTGFEPCVWFAINAHPGRMWGCHVMLEGGAVYRNVPAHKIAFRPDPEPFWAPNDAQVWDVYGQEFSVIEYKFLANLRALTRAGVWGWYLFTVVPMNDAFSEAPDQAKEFKFLHLDNGRLAILPTNKLVFHDRSYDREPSWPTDLKLSDTIWRIG